MNIILHGATNSSNFGDFLFAKMFYDRLEKINNGKNKFYEFPKLGIGDFYRIYIPYDKKQKIKDLKNADLLVYFSGGYFGESNSSLKETFIRYVRYFMIGKYFCKKKKKIAIIGVGGGPISNKFLRKLICEIMEKAEIVIVRDKKTYEYFKKYGVKREIIVTADTVLSFDTNLIPKLDNEINTKMIKTTNKRILLHLYGNEKIDNKIEKLVIADLNKFLKKHSEYSVFISYDGIPHDKNEYKQIFNNIEVENKFYYEYEDPMQFTSFLNNMDVVITPKLHTGIFSYVLQKSVISIPMHPEKTKRFYEMINENDRCISLSELNSGDIYRLLERYHNKKIIKNMDLVNTANQNLIDLENVINRLEKDNEIEKSIN